MRGEVLAMVVECLNGKFTSMVVPSGAPRNMTDQWCPLVLSIPEVYKVTILLVAVWRISCHLQIMALPAVPVSLKAIQHYVKTAGEHDARDPAVAYYCEYFLL